MATKRATRSVSKVPTRATTKKNTVAPPPPGPVDDMEGFDEENGGVITQVATHERDGLLDEELQDDLEFYEPGDTSEPVAAGTSQDISSMPRPQPTPQPTRRVVVSPKEEQRGMRGGSNPANPVKSAEPFRGGSILNGRKWPDVDRRFCEVIFRKVKTRMTENGVMNVRNQSKADVRSAFLQVMFQPFENKEYFDDMVAQFCLVHNILKP